MPSPPSKRTARRGRPARRSGGRVRGRAWRVEVDDDRREPSDGCSTSRSWRIRLVDPARAAGAPAASLDDLDGAARADPDPAGSPRPGRI